MERYIIKKSEITRTEVYKDLIVSFSIIESSDLKEKFEYLELEIGNEVYIVYGRIRSLYEMGNNFCNVQIFGVVEEQVELIEALQNNGYRIDFYLVNSSKIYINEKGIYSGDKFIAKNKGIHLNYKSDYYKI